MSQRGELTAASQPIKVYSRMPKALPHGHSFELEQSPVLEEAIIVDDLDVPIAIKKGVRSCTKHSIFNYLTYSKLSPKCRAFATMIDIVEFSKDIQSALHNPKWKEVVLEEMNLGYCGVVCRKETCWM